MHWQVLAESTIMDIATPVGTIGVCLFMLKWFMTVHQKMQDQYRGDTQERNAVIERLSDRSNQVIERNTAAFEQHVGETRNLTQAIRGCPHRAEREAN